LDEVEGRWFYHRYPLARHPGIVNTVAAIINDRLKLAFCTTHAVCVLVLAQGPSFMRLRRALLRQRGVHKMRGSDGHLKRSGMTNEEFNFY
jgi:hypothetical protein